MYSKIEDTIMKNICDLFSDDAPKYFGIDKKVVGVHRTELNYIQPKDNFMDYVFLLEDGTLLHFEFQSTYKKSDISRFMVYDAVLYYKEGRRIITVVIYSSDITEVVNTLDIGSISYKIKPFYMVSLNGDKAYQEIKAKIDDRKPLTKQDLMSIVFLPIMSSQADVLTRIEQAVDLSKKIENTNEQMQIQAMLSLLAEKFIKDENQLQRVKELLHMGKILEMTLQEGVEKGIKEGIKEGILETAKNALKKGFSIKDVSEITGLDMPTIEELKSELKII